MEASALPGSVGLARPRIGLGIPLLRLRSDEQLVSLFRAGSDDAFRVIHDRYRQRLQAYSRQMLAGSTADAEDVVQEIFVRAYGGLRRGDRELALRAWLYRIAHNRCIDEIRRPRPITTEAVEELTATDASDPIACIEQRDALRRLIADVRRLPEQQRSALLMRELGGMPYADLAEALGVSVPATKSLLVRARVGLAQAGEARDTACARIREDLIVAHDRGVRTSGLARRHMRDCPDCRRFRSEVRGASRQFAALVPALGPIGVIAKLLGVGSAGGGGAAASTGAVATSSAAGGTGAVASVGAVAAGAGHVVTLIAAAAVVTAGGAIELQQISHPATHHARHHHVVRAAEAPEISSHTPLATAAGSPAAVADTGDLAAMTISPAPPPAPSSVSRGPRLTGAPVLTPAPSVTRGTTGTPGTPGTAQQPLPISELIDPDHLDSNPSASTPTPSGTAPTTTAPGTAPATGTQTTGTPTTTTTTPTGTTTTGTVPTTITTPTGTPITGTGPATTTTPTSGASPSGQPSTGLAPLTQTSKTSGTGSGTGGGIALGATGSSTRRTAVRVYKSRHH